MDRQKMIAEREWVRQQLKGVADFWLKNGMDSVHGGIYTCLDPDVQAQVEEVYNNADNLDYYSTNGKHLQSAISVIDNATGDLVGIQHDVGIFQLPDGRRYIISMFTGDLASDLEGITTISKVSKAVYEALR